MKENEIIFDLIKSINNTLSILENIDTNYKEFKDKEFVQFGQNKFSGIIIAKIIADFYTCLETMFLRISQFFENSLQKDRWHSDLLQKMTLDYNGLRKRVISEKTYYILLEFLKFRHFTRYYFQYEYDWDKLGFLEKKYIQVRPLVIEDINHFKEFLNQLIQPD